ncbi:MULTISPECIES: hypothetical protein [unclassified Mesorhizobium]|uniref:hypothetical protein n=1 Tax=unclassified Mesorhizobium TaxID=325217 RepID=UPI0012EB8B82|nr:MULTISPECIES: hypothetical protein [unclassified Mesorhizobium]WJI74829.1 hypothetical protein NLY37_28570 [Mesorhizobium sp. C395A]
MDLDKVWAWLNTPGATATVSTITFVVGGVLGFLARSLTSTPAERQQQRQRLYENGLHHKTEREKRYVEFCDAIGVYIEKKKIEAKLTLDDFQSISKAGDLYFSELKMASDAIIGNSIDKVSRETIVSAIAEALEKNIPLYYETLHRIADKIGVTYSGEFKRPNYENMYVVVEKYASNAVMPPAASSQPTLATPNG